MKKILGLSYPKERVSLGNFEENYEMWKRLSKFLSIFFKFLIKFNNFPAFFKFYWLLL